MQKYGNVEDLPQDIEEKINVLITKMEQIENHDSISIYYGYPFIELDGQETIMKACIVSLNGIISVYTNDNEKNVYNRHLTKVLLDSQVLSEIYFADPQKVLHNVMIDSMDWILELLTDTEQCFSVENYKEANAIIQNMYGLNHIDERKINNEGTMGALIKKRNNEINMLDENQFVTIYKKINAHTRIRGLAGSGKTILLVKKMAYMHYKNRDLELAYVFYTKSLKQYIKDLFFNFYRDFEKYKEPDMDKIHILHSWGGAEMEGFYSRTCKENGVARQGYNDVIGSNKFDRVCFNLLDNLGGKGKKLYDYVFVDEAQDFSLGFFRLVLSTLKFNGKMIYAYDELQSLNDSVETIPGKQSIFQKEICEDINLSICYRSPKEIIVTAHALGLGVYRKNKEGKTDIVNMMQDYSIWKAIGYDELDGKLEYGENVRLGRKEVIDYKPEQCVEINDEENEEAQYASISEEICRLIQDEDVLPEDILIIDLAAMKFQDHFLSFKKSLNSIIEDVIKIDNASRNDETIPPILSIGIALTGSIDAEKQIIISSHNVGYLKNLKKEMLISPDLLLALKEHDIPIIIDHNAKALAVCEKYSLYQADNTNQEYCNKKNIVSLYLGSGIGSGLILDNRLARGCRNLNGEIGHIEVPRYPGLNGKELIESHCTCGATGCLENYIINDVFRMTRNDFKGLTSKELVEKLDSLYPEEKQERLKILGYYIGWIVDLCVKFLNVGLIIFSGKITSLMDELWQYITPSNSNVDYGRLDCALIKSKYGALAPTIGAAILSTYPANESIEWPMVNE